MSRGSLRRILLDRSIVMEQDHIRRFALDVCQGMTYLHSMSVIHRDLKASNLLVDNDWNIKVSDFGIARDGQEDVTMTMTACGTPAWAAPEVLQTQRYSFKADVYSFAVCLWEMCTREIPYEGTPPYQIVIYVATQGLRPELHHPVLEKMKGFKTLMRLCWDEDPNKRPAFSDLIEKFNQMVCPPLQNENPVKIICDYTSEEESKFNSRK